MCFICLASRDYKTILNVLRLVLFCFLYSFENEEKMENVFCLYSKP